MLDFQSENLGKFPIISLPLRHGFHGRRRLRKALRTPCFGREVSGSTTCISCLWPTRLFSISYCPFTALEVRRIPPGNKEIVIEPGRDRPEGAQASVEFPPDVFGDQSLWIVICRTSSISLDGPVNKTRGFRQHLPLCFRHTCIDTAQ